MKYFIFILSFASIFLSFTYSQCDELSELPVPFNTFQDISNAESFAFDSNGNIVTIKNDALVRINFDGEIIETITMLGESGVFSGIDILPDGDVVLANTNNGTVIKIDLDTGGWNIILTGISYPKGVVVGTDGHVYVTGAVNGEIFKVNIDSSEIDIIANIPGGASALAFNLEGDIMYATSMNDNRLWAIFFDEEWGDPVLINTYGNNIIDGINTDGCGNVYLSEYITGIIWRIDPQDSNSNGEIVASLPSNWIPNIEWGVGLSDQNILYASDRGDGELFALEVGYEGAYDDNVIYGCTDPYALNYNSDATIDDGSCEYDENIYGCTDPNAINYNSDATIDDGSCEYDENIYGCTYNNASNYNPNATIDDGSCEYDENIYGCTYNNASNYNPNATIDDGTCEFLIGDINQDGILNVIDLVALVQSILNNIF